MSESKQPVRRLAGLVREQQTKCKDLRRHLREWVDARPGVWTLGGVIADTVLAQLKAAGIHTFSNVLSKELRKAERLGEIRKRLNENRMVEYTKTDSTEGALFDFEAKVHGVSVGGKR